MLRFCSILREVARSYFFRRHSKRQGTAVSALRAPLYNFSCAVLTGRANNEICIFVVRKSLLFYTAVMDDGV